MLVVVPTLVAAGCGELSDREQIVRLVHEFGRDVADGRGDDACGAFADSAFDGNGGREGCVALVEAAPTVATEQQLRELRDLRVESVAVRGDDGFVRLREASVLTNPDLTVRRINGRWRITA